MKITAIIQARMGSARLPGKMLMDLCGYPVLYWVLTRVKGARKLDDVILATTSDKRDDRLSDLAKDFSIPVFRGSEDDVLARFENAARIYKPDIVVRVCADNPLIASEEIDRLVEFYLDELGKGRDPAKLYSFNHLPALENNYPDGLGAEIFSRNILENIFLLASKLGHREHVTTYIWDNYQDYDIHPLKAPFDIAYPQVKLDLDTPEDLIKLRALCDRLNLKSSPGEIIQAYFDLFGVK